MNASWKEHIVVSIFYLQSFKESLPNFEKKKKPKVLDYSRLLFSGILYRETIHRSCKSFPSVEKKKLFPSRNKIMGLFLILNHICSLCDSSLKLSGQQFTTAQFNFDSKPLDARDSLRPCFCFEAEPWVHHFGNALGQIITINILDL